MAKVSVYVPDDLWKRYSEWRDSLPHKESQERANTSQIVQNALKRAMKGAK